MTTLIIRSIARVTNKTGRALYDKVAAQNQMRYAAALLESGAAQEAAINHEACLQGPFSDDLDIKFNASRAFVASSRYDEESKRLREVTKVNI
jgi:hypothetical protein